MRCESKTCVQCGKEFHGDFAHGRDTWRRRKYCSRACKHVAQRGYRAPELTKACAVCGRKFRNRRSNGSTIDARKWAGAKYCSPECRWAGMLGQEPANKGQRLDPREQIERHVDKTSSPHGCWLWTGTKSAAGYGHVQVNGKKTLAHRVSYMVFNGPIPEGAGFHGTVVRHKCDNPSCVNPAHLELGSQYTNMQDRDERGRRIAPVGSDHPGAKLAEADVIAIRAVHAAGRHSQQEIAAMYGISFGMVSLIVNRKNWKHI